MINLAFVSGSSLRRVVINNRLVSMMSQETGFAPIKMDLDKIDEKQIKKKMGKEGLKFIRQLANLKTEEDLAKDITKDFQATGWRRIKQDGNI